MHAMTSVALEARRNVVEIALELLVPETPRELGLWAMTLLSQWYREVQGEWKTSIDGAVQRIVSNLYPSYCLERLTLICTDIGTRVACGFECTLCATQ